VTILDISPPLRAGIAVWPGDAAFGTTWTMRRDRGDSVNVARIGLSVHTGAHVDAPRHISDDGATVGDLPLDRFVGPCRVVDVSERVGPVGFDEIADRLPARVERLLVRTRRSSDPGRWDPGFRPIDPALLDALADRGLRLLGTDAPSLDPADSKTLDAHRAAVRRGVVNLEGLVLDGAAPGDYELIALPLRLDLDGSPVRAVLRTIDR
jgi:arylformamidase